MAGTTVKSRLTLGAAGSILRHLVISLNKLVDDVELVRAGAIQCHLYQIEDLSAGADITARAIYKAPRAMTVLNTVRAVYGAASAGVDGSNTTIITLKNITENVDIASFTTTATTSANVAETLTLTAANADIASGDVLGVVVTNGNTADTPLIVLQWEMQPQTIDAAADVTGYKIGNDAGTAYTE